MTHTTQVSMTTKIIASFLVAAVVLAVFIGFIAIRVTDEPYCEREPEPTEMALREFTDRCLAPIGAEGG